MGATTGESLSPEEHEIFAAMVERMPQLRRKSGAPDGVNLPRAVALHMVSADEVAQARWGDAGPPASTAGMRDSHGLS